MSYYPRKYTPRKNYEKKYKKMKKGTGKKNAKAYYDYKQTKRSYLDARQDEKRARGPGFISTAGGVIGGGIGGFLGGPAGALTGAGLGAHAGHLVEQITGFGDYKVIHNSLMRGGISPPQIINRMKNGATVIRHREYITDINASTAFQIQTYALNPALASSFPWLSQIASAYDEYQWEGMIFEFKSLSSDAILSTSASTSLGAVIMATQYNSLNPPFADKRSMENYEFGNSAKPSLSFIHPVECKASVTPLTKLYTRTGAIVPGSDQRLYDLGEFNIATQGMQANGGVVGELWVSYQVALYKEKVNPSDLTDHFDTLTYTNALPLGSDVTAVNASAATRQSSLGCQIATNGGGGQDIRFPATISSGVYYLTITWIGTVAATLTLPSLGTTNLSLLQWFQGDSATSMASPLNGVSSLAASQQYFIRVTGQGAILTVNNNGTLPSGTNRIQIVITQVSSNLIG